MWDEELERGGIMSACSLGGTAFLPVVFGDIVRIDGISNVEKYWQVLIHYAIPSGKELSWSFSASQWSQAHC